MKKKITAFKAVRCLKKYLRAFEYGHGRLRLDDVRLDVIVGKETGLSRWMWGFNEEELKVALRKEFPTAKRLSVSEAWAESTSFYVSMTV